MNAAATTPPVRKSLVCMSILLKEISCCFRMQVPTAVTNRPRAVVTRKVVFVGNKPD
jgi:hypothetical protein